MAKALAVQSDDLMWIPRPLEIPRSGLAPGVTAWDPLGFVLFEAGCPVTQAALLLVT